MISTGGVGGESPWPGVGGAHDLERSADSARCRVIASRVRFSSSPSRSCLPLCCSGLCLSGSAGSRCRRPRPCVLVRPHSPARGGGWGLVPLLGLLAVVRCCRPAAPGWRLLPMGGRDARCVIRARAGPGNRRPGVVLVAAVVAVVPGGCRRPGKGGPAVSLVLGPVLCRAGGLHQHRAATVPACCSWMAPFALRCALALNSCCRLCSPVATFSSPMM